MRARTHTRTHTHTHTHTSGVHEGIKSTNLPSIRPRPAAGPHVSGCRAVARAIISGGHDVQSRAHVRGANKGNGYPDSAGLGSRAYGGVDTQQSGACQRVRGQQVFFLYYF